MPDKPPSEEGDILWPKVQKVLLGVIGAVGTTIVYTLFGATILDILTRIDFIYGITVGIVIGSILTILLSPYWSGEIEDKNPTEVTITSSDSLAEIFIKGLRLLFLFVGFIIATGSIFAVISGQFGLLTYFLIAGGSMYYLSSKDYSELSMRQVLLDFNIALGWIVLSLLSGMAVTYYMVEKTIGDIRNLPEYLSLPLMLITFTIIFAFVIMPVPFWLLPAESEEISQ